ncbi:MAG: SBBP repeat-containing protein [Leptospiraceae bacterium]|nr:SBBP repeat-containing protein [Leptospiraceae bacterium]MCP5494801.1 SBBP repeat-containing protein [Leptospiraceae bacterium]
MRLIGVEGSGSISYGIAVNNSNNLYAVGATTGDLDGQTYTGDEESTDVVITKYDINGNKQWTRLLGANGKDASGIGVTSDSSDNVYATGLTYNDLDGQTKTGLLDMFIAKYDGNGNQTWLKLVGNTLTFTGGTDVTVNSNDEIYVTGDTTGNLNGQTTVSGLTNTDLFLIKYDSSGNTLWTQLLGVSGVNTNARGIALDSSGNVYIAGYTQGNLNNETLTGTQDMAIAKYDGSGNLKGVKLLGIAGCTTAANAIKVDSNGNIYITGWTTGSLDGQTLTGENDLFLVKYDGSGNKQWTRLLGASGSKTQASDLTLDSGSNIYVTGWTLGDLDGQTSIGTRDAFVVKYDTNGNKQWTKLLGNEGIDTIGAGITTDSSNNIYGTGWTYGDLEKETKTGTIDIFITKYKFTP